MPIQWQNYKLIGSQLNGKRKANHYAIERKENNRWIVGGATDCGKHTHKLYIYRRSTLRRNLTSVYKRKEAWGKRQQQLDENLIKTTQKKNCERSDIIYSYRFIHWHFLSFFCVGSPTCFHLCLHSFAPNTHKREPIAFIIVESELKTRKCCPYSISFPRALVNNICLSHNCISIFEITLVCLSQMFNSSASHYEWHNSCSFLLTVCVSTEPPSSPHRVSAV